MDNSRIFVLGGRNLFMPFLVFSLETDMILYPEETGFKISLFVQWLCAPAEI